MRSQSSLNSHEKVCPNLKMGTNINSFFKNSPLQPPTSFDRCANKVLPSSQPLSPPEEDEITIPPSQNLAPLKDVISGTDETIENSFDPSQPLFLSSEEETPADSDENDCCPLCKEGPVQDGISCHTCKAWCHQTCLNMSDEEFELLTNNPDTTHWFCVRYLAIQPNNIKWGKYEGEFQIT